MSKSRGNVVRPEPLRQVIGPDPLRYFLLREVGFESDGNFSWERFDERYIADLAVSRSFEGRGVGRLLIEAAEDWAHTRGYRLLTLYVFSGNVRAQRVYERHGFQPEAVKYVKVIGRKP